MRGSCLRKNRARVVFYVFLIVVLTLPNYVRNSKADIISVDNRGTGSFFPVENCSLIMTYANVAFDVNYPDIFNNIDLSFNANYTIYNPNDSLNITLIAPFSTSFNNLESTCSIKIAENNIPFNVKEYDFYDFPWDIDLYLYLDEYSQTRRKFIIFNASIANNSSIKIEFEFKAVLSNKFYDSNDILRIFYDVGTSRTWNGTITEQVEFRVKGKLPEDFSDYCIISESANGKSYAWEWENERIMINSVFISYKNPWSTFRRLLPFIIFPSMVLVPIIIVLISRRRKKRKSIWR
jgi:hypothetical protein